MGAGLIDVQLWEDWWEIALNPNNQTKVIQGVGRMDLGAEVPGLFLGVGFGLFLRCLRSCSVLQRFLR